MDEEVGRVVRGLHGEQQLICFDPLHGESWHPDELNESNRNSYLLMGDAISVLEKLAAENERLQARCEAAERDLEEMIHEQGGNLDLCHWCAGNCASGEYLCDTNGVWRGPGKEEAE